MPDYLTANRAYWNTLAEQHFDSEFYNNNAFLSTQNSLNEIELALLGNDLSGQRVLHLQCHFGQDTLSLARLGAEVTGIDLSDVAIAKAYELAKRTGLKARFLESDVQRIDEVLGDEQFDLIFSSYGTIGWLPKVDRWAQLIAQYLSPGGRFVFAEFHPVVWMMAEDFTHVKYPYFNREVIYEEPIESYGGAQVGAGQGNYSWNHDLGEVLGALLDAGLQLTHFSEYDYSPYDCFPGTVKSDKGFQIKGLEGKLPMVYALEARK
ncbi:MAG: class I SAM-dependent methyltransferase [Bacteroidetes bacterium]|nr:MAG: class I SAM-dependent methyltransferase [Bacteroidota bacterium]